MTALRDGAEPMPGGVRGRFAGSLLPALRQRETARSRAGARFAAVAVFDAPEACEAAWRALQAVACISPYQRFDWIAAWLRTEGRAAGIRPLVGVASDGGGRPVALLPLGLRRRGPVTVASFLGGRSSNYNLGLFEPGAPWSAAESRALLAALAAGAPVRPDLFLLQNQPLAWNGWPNPLAALPHQPSPSQAYRAVLVPDGEAFLREHQSGPARKKMRSKLNQLEKLGPVQRWRACGHAEVEALVDAHLAQKAAKLAALGITGPADAPAHRRMLVEAATVPADTPPLELHALLCGDRLVATFGGLAHGSRFSGLLISHDETPAFARLSPGEQLLAAVIREKCEAGFASFDLGIGEARYKQAFCPIADPLVDTLMPVTARGRLFVAGEGGRLRLKGAIKRSDWAWRLATGLRRRLARPRPA